MAGKVWRWLYERFPRRHNCNEWQMYWQEENTRGIYCAICGNTISEERYGNE